MDLSVIGINNSEYAVKVIGMLLANNLVPRYSIIEDINIDRLALSAYLIDTGQLPDKLKHNRKWEDDLSCPFSMVNKSINNGIPYFSVSSHNSRYTERILSTHPVDILIITEGPIIRGPILYMPRICVMNVHAAPLPQYRGNWTTRMSIYNDEPPTVSAHVVTPWIDEGFIISRMQYKISTDDTLEDIDRKAMDACAELAAVAVKTIIEKGFNPEEQLIWEGNTYKGKVLMNEIMPAMPFELQDDLRIRLQKGEYGFYE